MFEKSYNSENFRGREIEMTKHCHVEILGNSNQLDTLLKKYLVIAKAL